MSMRTILLVLVTSLSLVTGCRRSAGGGASGVKGTVDGVSCEVRGRGGESSDRIVEGVHEFTAGDNKLRLQDGHVIANGKDYGAVKSGDSVLLDADGNVTVNSQKR
jgi:hypothetical protein